jgi:hypothetical protein
MHNILILEASCIVHHSRELREGCIMYDADASDGGGWCIAEVVLFSGRGGCKFVNLED